VLPAAHAEKAAFDTWLAEPRGSYRLTGWQVWQASLVHRGVSEAAAGQSRLAFDAWRHALLEADPVDNWTEFDAWSAAAKWFADAA
jgi:hypothetical protein